MTQRIADVLVRRVFLAYLAAATVITLVMVVLDAREIKAGVAREVALHAASVEGSVARALWSMDLKAVAEVAKGLDHVPLIAGVQVIDAVSNTAVGSSGRAVDGFGADESRFPLVFRHETGVEKVGVLVIKTAPSQFWERLWPKLASVLVGAALKTLILGWILLRATEYIVQRPLKRLTGVVRSFNPDAGAVPGAALASVSDAPRSELHLLAETFDEMAVRVAENAQLRERATYLERTELLARRLEQSNAELEQFAYVVSHDLRQPLRNVSSFILLLERHLGENLDATAREYMGFVGDGARRMNKMIVDILEYSRVGQHERPTTVVSLAEVLAEVEDMYRPTMEEVQARLVCAAALPDVLGDHGDLVRLFQNLIGNALKYRHPDHSPEIRVTACRKETEWVVAVADNGVGIDPSALDRIFKVFVRLHNLNVEGSGIGLAVCRKIAEHHSGRIWVESPGEGRGSTFYIAFRPAES
jgi:signal transduction histidine kinase